MPRQPLAFETVLAGEQAHYLPNLITGLQDQFKTMHMSVCDLGTAGLLYHWFHTTLKASDYLVAGLAIQPVSQLIATLQLDPQMIATATPASATVAMQAAKRTRHLFKTRVAIALTAYNPVHACFYLGIADYDHAESHRIHQPNASTASQQNAIIACATLLHYYMKRL